MSRLNSNFDIISHDPHSNALAGLMEVLDLASPTSPAANGTPTLGTVGPGTIVVMDSDGKAIVADNADASTNAPVMMFTVIDGDVDFDGAFTGKVTCLQGGGDLLVTNYKAASYTPGAMLTCDNTTPGDWRAAASGEQIYGVVGPRGLDTVNSVLHVIIPQGISPAVA